MTATARAVARVIRNDAARKISANILASSEASTPRYSPTELLSHFDQSSTLTVKRSPKRRGGRFFMYEEHASTKLRDDNVAQTIAVAPGELATLLTRRRRSDGGESGDGHHYYWTAPVAAAAPALTDDFRWLLRLREAGDPSPLDPRGPSLWMGTSGSGTQCHYDVADNVIVQLHGSKRVRCYPPGAGARHLHVFPDAHPRARKSQVDFDGVAGGDASGMERFPHFVDSPPPSLDVVLRPGDALEIPAFWFHHVENGRAPNVLAREAVRDEEFEDAPSVSVNSFSLSRPMMVAQQIFQKASLQPLLAGTLRGAAGDAKLASSVLGALGTSLVRGLNVVDNGEERDFIRRYLLDARYVPLLGNIVRGESSARGENGSDRTARQSLTEEQLRVANSCVERILPDFRQLRAGGGEEDDRAGVALLVVLHLLELWAVELVGASLVAKAWDEALS
eukprot:CAMPEP_0172532576 /NCGR_PEP_ID=MMETSP1067-20121228/5576_1 /TAXON_ID=265564 ORGANISM="Thalassiosira punctigera, Strain Tpunct2005C2" /NCGR_SAMPLE_ID=MMETSP1067 /ASSEMBLY_ACC=CAM_ASM_000444 /LENGTH=449 /DNA_ID=CAMNT_0013317107 /DNA_START=11 /DNA_END=1360 /DNA_ORIENTATION=-